MTYMSRFGTLETLQKKGLLYFEHNIKIDYSSTNCKINIYISKDCPIDEVMEFIEQELPYDVDWEIIIKKSIYFRKEGD